MHLFILFLCHRTSFFLIGFYTLALVCLVLILQFGVLEQVHPPSTTLRGLFVLACVVAGGAGGAITIFFWKLSRYLIGGWGGFALALFIQCFRDGGLIREIGYRWIMFIGKFGGAPVVHHPSTAHFACFGRRYWCRWILHMHHPETPLPRNARVYWVRRRHGSYVGN